MDTSIKPTEARASRILARSFYRELRENGFSCNQILALSTELIDLVTRELRAGTTDTWSAAERGGSGQSRQAV